MVGFFLFMVTVVLGVLALVGGLQWIGGRSPRLDPGGVDPSDRSAAALERMEAALAALEGRVDDLQDQQRFLERLLADRPERPALGEGDSRSILFDTGPSEEASGEPSEGDR